MLFCMLNSVWFVLLDSHFLQYVCSAKYGCFLQFLNFMLSWYVTQLLSE